MDKLEKSKRVGMCNFLVEMLITDFGYRKGNKALAVGDMTKEIILDRAVRQGFVIVNPLRVSRLGLDYIEKWKDLK